MFGKTKKINDMDMESTKAYKEMIMRKLLNDLTKLDLSNYSIIFELPESRQNEYNIKTMLLNENINLFNDDEKRYITSFIIQQDTISHMNEAQILTTLSRNHTEEQLHKPLVLELAKHANVNTIEDIEKVYKEYILDKNKEKFVDEDFEEAKTFISSGFKKAGK